MEIEPATLAQVAMGRDGKMHEVDDDVGGIALRLKEIDDSLRLRWNEFGGFFVIYQMLDTAEGLLEKLVLTAQELDGRIIKRVEQITHPSYDFVAEMDRMDEQAQKDKDHAFHEQTGEVAERMAHAVRKDLEAQNKAFVPKDVE